MGGDPREHRSGWEVREEGKAASSVQLAPWRLQFHLPRDAGGQWRALWKSYPSRGAFRHQLPCLWVRPAGRWVLVIRLPEKAQAVASWTLYCLVRPKVIRASAKEKASFTVE